MAKSHKSATLPPNFLVQAQPVGQPEENEGFFSKLKKRFKLKKGKYNVDINTGECENVSAVSFKKRESAELLAAQDESPLKYQVGRSSERITRSASPKTSKPASRNNSDRVAANSKDKKLKGHPSPNLEGRNSTIAKLAENYRGNEYSFMKFDKDDPVLLKPITGNIFSKVDDECRVNDDSAIDLDGTDVDSHHVRPSVTKDDSASSKPLSPDPGYERLPLTQHITDNDKDTDSIFDPNYESVKDVKDRIKQNEVRLSKSIDSLDDPNYQSINDVKRKKEELFGASGQKPKKTYSMFESIESLDEPGYESLSDVKRKMMEQHLSKSNSVDQKSLGDSSKELTGITEGGGCDDSAVELAEMNDSISGAVNSGGNISNKNTTGLEDSTNTSTALTDSSRSKDSGFESRTEKSPEHENPEDLYSKVRKRSEEPTETSTANKITTTTTGQPAIKMAPANEEFDSDVELSLEPGYAECADAIKGVVPGLSIYSDGSGSKMSSCNSLDLSAEDFVTEPGYAECADAIKTGVIKKISVSNERLVDSVKLKRHSVDEATLRKGGGEIYANPQILFRKRSKLLDDRNSGEFTGSSESLMSNASAKSKEPELKNEPPPILEAPPLPARNYSLYLDSEEADKIVPSPESTDPSNPENLDIDDAFEEAAEAELEKLKDDVDVSAILQIEQELKEELRNEPALKTPDDVDEVTRAIESKFPDTVKVHDPFAELMDDDEEVCKSDEFLVEIPDSESGRRFLTIKEKHESVHIQEKRKSVKQKTESKIDSNCSSQKFEVSENVNKCETVENVAKTNSEVENNNIRSDSVPLTTDTEVGIPSDQKTTVSVCDTEERRPIDLVIPAIMSESENCESADRFRTELKDKLNISREILTQNITSDCIESSAVFPSVQLDRLSLQESPLRMLSLSSVDSDDDLETTEALPKLEINENEWDNAFDESNSQIVPSSKTLQECNKSAEVLEDVKECVDISTEQCAKSDEPLDEIDGFVVQTIACDNVKTRQVTEIDKAATLTTRLCVIEPEESRCIVVDSVTAEDCVDGLDSLVDSADVSDEGVAISVESATDCVESQRSPLVGIVASSRLNELSNYNDMIPNLYEDSEPTHMSMREIMTLSGSDLSAFRLAPESDTASKDSKSDGANCQSNVSSSHIPSSFEDIPPPRPPSYSSHQSSKVTPTDEIPPPYRLAANEMEGIRLVTNEMEGATEDGSSPPAIPPRAKIRKQPRPGSASQDFMESMRQLKDYKIIATKREMAHTGANSLFVTIFLKVIIGCRDVNIHHNECGWYWGPLSWEEAEQKLSNKPEGTFLVRDSSDERYILSLSFKNQGRVHHTRIEHHKGHFSFWSQPDSHGKSTIKEFIEQCVNNSRNGRFLYFIRPSGPGSPPMPIHLLHPVSRFVQMQSLQHSCRFCILQLVRRDHIDSLPVPTRIKQYLKEAQYYVEYLDD